MGEWNENSPPDTPFHFLSRVYSPTLDQAHRSGFFHYHMVVKFSARRHCLELRNYLDEKHSVKVNFHW